MAKSKYTPERIKKIYEALRLGLSYKSSAQYGGISEDTFYEWIKVHPEFSEGIKQAEIESEKELVEYIRNDVSWQSKAWMLERRLPERWGRVERVKQEISGPSGQPVQLEVSLSEKLKKYEHLWKPETP